MEFGSDTTWNQSRSSLERYYLPPLLNVPPRKSQIKKVSVRKGAWESIKTYWRQVLIKELQRFPDHISKDSWRHVHVWCSYLFKRINTEKVESN
jgi:hypothetical protein